MILIWLLVLHFIGDFIFQSHEMAMNKSKDKKVLMAHCARIGLFLFLGTFNITFTVINMSLHALIDWNIWRTYKKDKHPDFKFWEDHNFYCVIGFDQLLHTSILILTWLILRGGIK